LCRRRDDGVPRSRRRILGWALHIRRRGVERRRLGARRRFGNRLGEGGHRSHGGGRCRRRGLGRRRRLRARREQAERIDVAMRIGGNPHAEVDVRGEGDGVGALADGADDGALGDDAAAQDADRAELEKRDRIAVRALDRDRAAATRDHADEGHVAPDRRAHRAPHRTADVDAAVLAARIDVVAEDEGPQHLPLDRPCPGWGGRHNGERR
jgi:hypothetical protein